MDAKLIKQVTEEFAAIEGRLDQTGCHGDSRPGLNMTTLWQSRLARFVAVGPLALGAVFFILPLWVQFPHVRAHAFGHSLHVGFIVPCTLLVLGGVGIARRKRTGILVSLVGLLSAMLSMHLLGFASNQLVLAAAAVAVPLVIPKTWSVVNLARRPHGARFDFYSERCPHCGEFGVGLIAKLLASRGFGADSDYTAGCANCGSGSCRKPDAFSPWIGLGLVLAAASAFLGGFFASVGVWLTALLIGIDVVPLVAAKANPSTRAPLVELCVNLLLGIGILACLTACWWLPALIERSK